MSISICRGDAPLILTFPHGGIDLPDGAAEALVSPWLARKDADHWIELLYDFAQGLGATTIRTSVSRSVIDTNRDPSGASLYPGQATTELCPTTSFDGEPLYVGATPDAAEIAQRRKQWFDPYHAAIEAEIARLRARHPRVVVYDCHSIRSRIPRLFDGELPELNIGTNCGLACAVELRDAVAGIAAASGRRHVVDGRFRGGWTTRHYGRPQEGVHAIQMELAIRAYLSEPSGAVTPADWPPPWNPDVAAPLRATLAAILTACLDFAQ